MPNRRKNKPPVKLVKQIELIENAPLGNNNNNGTRTRAAKNKRRRLRKKLAMVGTGTGVGRLIVESMSTRLPTTDTVQGMAWLGKILDPSHPAAGGTCLDVPDRVSANVICASATQVDSMDCLEDGSGSAYYIGSAYQAATTVAAFSQAELKTFWQALCKSSGIWNLLIWVSPATGMIYTLKYVNFPAAPLKFLGDHLISEASVVESDKKSPTDLYLLETWPYLVLNNLFASRFGISKMRMVYHGTTCEFTGPTVKDQGEVVAAQTSIDWREAEVIVEANKGMAKIMMPFGTGIAKDFLKKLVRNIPQASPKSYSSRAKAGYYCVSAVDNPVFPFLSINAGEYNADASGALESFDGEDIFYSHPLIGYMIAKGQDWTKARIKDLNMTPAFYSKERFCFQTQIVSFTGLSIESSFKFTTRYGVSLIPDASSLLNLFASPSPRVDETALKLAIDIRQELDDFYPSSYNQQDTLWQKVKTLATGLFGYIKPALGAALTSGATALPGLGPFLGPMVGTLADHLGWH